MKYGVGVAVGRFQVDDLHEGHQAILAAAAAHPKMMVVLGQHPFLATRENPLDFPTRRAMVQARYPEAVVVFLNDCPTDVEWSKRLDELVRSVYPVDEARLYCGRAGFAPHYRGKLRVVELDTVALHTGTQRREYVGSVPLASQDFRRGVIYATRNQYTQLKPTVDVAAYGPRGVLLGRKHGEVLWRFPGGFVDPEDTGYEAAAKRELFEETGLAAEHGVVYVGSYRVDDWRRTHSCGIFTVLYAAQAMTTGAVAGDDLHEVRWFAADELLAATAPAHRPLAEGLLAWRRKNAASESDS